MTYYNNIINIWTKARTETYVRVKWNCARTPYYFKAKYFKAYGHKKRSYAFVTWFPDMSVAIRIWLLACFYTLKANRDQLSKYFEVYMILKNDCTERPLLAIEVWNAEVETCIMRLFHPPLGLQFSMGHVNSVHQGLGSTRGKSLGTRLVENINWWNTFRLHEETWPITAHWRQEYIYDWNQAKMGPDGPSINFSVS
jgi:hypothetical protein